MLARRIAKEDRLAKNLVAESTSDFVGAGWAVRDRLLRLAINKRRAFYENVRYRSLFGYLRIRSVFHHLFVICLFLIDFGFRSSVFDDLVVRTATTNGGKRKDGKAYGRQGGENQA